ncbi:hypothetical protein V8F20_006137 [Naviculisporaceae sp. PSN 640]
MVAFTKLAIAVAATAITGAAARAKNCRYPYDNCGWVLASAEYGYTYAELSAAAGTNVGTLIYDALYSCLDTNGTIEYAYACSGPGKCQTGVVPNDNCLN